MKTIAAIATAQAAAGIGIVRISGDKAIEIADKVFVTASGEKLSSRSGYSAALGDVYDGETKIDKAIVLLFRAPKSYTGENVVEISGHGGPYVMSRILRAVLNAGAEPASPGEFTKRAFLNGKLDLSEAEAVMSVIGAKGEAGHLAALNALEGHISKKISESAAELTKICAHLAVWADYPEEDIEELSEESLITSLTTIKTDLFNLINSFDSGKAVIDGIETVIAGKPNVGKSTLLNLLSGSEKAIVTPHAGTTRDIIEETVRIGNVTLKLADTAGIHENISSEAEEIGVKRAVLRMERAPFVIIVLEASNELTKSEEELLRKAAKKKALVAINKTDLGIKLDVNKVKEYTENIVYISAKSGEGLREFVTAVENILGTADFDSSEPVLITERQRKLVSTALTCVNEALDAIDTGMTRDAVNISLDSAVNALLELTGERASEAVVDELFKSFCVGK